MSTFQIGLIIIGIIVLLLIMLRISLNLYKIHPSLLFFNTVFKKTNNKINPDLVNKSIQNIKEPNIPVIDTINKPIINNKHNFITPTIVARECPLNSTIDFICYLDLHSALTGYNIRKQLPIFTVKLEKPIFFSGKNIKSEKWELLQEQNEYKQVRAGIQLVNLTSIISELELSAFTSGIKEFAHNINAHAQIPELEQEISRIKIFANSILPIQQRTLTLNIYTKQEPWSINFIKEQAKQIGFIKTANPTIFNFNSLENYELTIFKLIYDQRKNINEQDINSINKISLVLEFYLIPEEEQPFNKMQVIAIELAKKLNGIIVDNNLNPIQQPHFKLIKQELQNRYQKLNDKGFATGSNVAKRLFA